MPWLDFSLSRESTPPKVLPGISHFDLPGHMICCTEWQWLCAQNPKHKRDGRVCGCFSSPGSAEVFRSRTMVTRRRRRKKWEPVKRKDGQASLQQPWSRYSLPSPLPAGMSRRGQTASLWKDMDTAVFEILVLTIYKGCMVQELCEQPGLSGYREEGEKKGELGTPLCVCSQSWMVQKV